MELFKEIGRNDPSYLIASPVGMDIISVSMKPGNGTVKRGTVIYRDAATGMWAPAAAAQVVATNQLAVIDETVDATGVHSGSTTIAESARAYRAGHFVTGKVTLKNDATLTAAAEVALRAQGIVFNRMVDTATFDNTTND